MLLCGWAVNKQITHSDQTPLANWSVGIHTEFTRWPTDFVTQKRDSFRQLLKFAINHFFGLRHLYSRSRACVCVCVVVTFPGCRRRGCNPTQTATLALTSSQFPSRAVTVGGGLEEIYTGGTHRLHTERLENWTTMNSGDILDSSAQVGPSRGLSTFPLLRLPGNYCGLSMKSNLLITGLFDHSR